MSIIRQIIPAFRLSSVFITNLSIMPLYYDQKNAFLFVGTI